MRFLFISDESGDDGLKFKEFDPIDIRKSEVTTHKVVLGILLPDLQSQVRIPHDQLLKDFLSRIDVLSTKHLGHPLRKWSNLKKHNKAASALIPFFQDLHKEFEIANVLISVAIIDKRFFDKAKEVEKETIRGYVVLYKRVIPFLKWLYFQCKWSGPPNLSWYIDKASNRNFVGNLRYEIAILSKNDIKLDGPHFLSKPKKETSERRTYSKLVVLSDFIAGAINRFLKEYYQKCFSLVCPNCFDNSEICINDYFPLWKEIWSIASTFSIASKRTKDTWQWRGILYLPSFHRRDFDVKRFIGFDPFFR
ncbi:MAG TPA: hypothetical protein DHV12_07020 [Thermotogae bacterium]|nr:hypothetical protein [Thermotogota bacterium]